jgi:hypothetical protein
MNSLTNTHPYVSSQLPLATRVAQWVDVMNVLSQFVASLPIEPGNEATATFTWNVTVQTDKEGVDVAGQSSAEADASNVLAAYDDTELKLQVAAFDATLAQNDMAATTYYIRTPGAPGLGDIIRIGAQN